MNAFGPLDDLIEYERFLRAIAKFRHPDPIDLPGLPGVVGKRTLDQRTKTWFHTTDLTLSDQIILQKLMAKHADALPRLRVMMRRKEILTFRRAFRTLEQRPDWEPVLRSDDDLIQLRSRRGDVYLRHASALKVEIAAGRIRHFDGDRIRTAPAFDFITYLTKEDAQIYLKMVGLDLATLLNSASYTSVESSHEVVHSSIINGDEANHESLGEQPRINSIVRSNQVAAAAIELGRSVIDPIQLASRVGLVAPSSPSIQKFLSVARPNPDNFKSHAGNSSPTKFRPPPTRSVRHQVYDPSPSAVPESAGASAPLMGVPERPLITQRIVLRIPELERRIGLKRSSIYDRLNPRSKYYDPSFPRPVSLGGNSANNKEKQGSGGAVGFHQDEIEQWIATRSQR